MIHYDILCECRPAQGDPRYAVHYDILYECRPTQGDTRYADAQEPAAAAGPGAVQGGAGGSRAGRPAAAAARRGHAARQAARLHARWQEVAHCTYSNNLSSANLAI